MVHVSETQQMETANTDARQRLIFAYSFEQLQIAVKLSIDILILLKTSISKSPTTIQIIIPGVAWELESNLTFFSDKWQEKSPYSACNGGMDFRRSFSQCWFM